MTDFDDLLTWRESSTKEVVPNVVPIPKGSVSGVPGQSKICLKTSSTFS